MLLPLLFLLISSGARSQDYTIENQAVEFTTRDSVDFVQESDYMFYDSVEDYELNNPKVDYNNVLSETLVNVDDDNDSYEQIPLDDMCRVSSGESNIVMDLMESLGNDFSQDTNPRELPIIGRVGSDIELELVFPSGYSIFKLGDKSIHLTEPLDRDQSDLSSIVFQVSN